MCSRVRVVRDEAHEPRHSRVVARRDHLHRRALQECREADLRQRRVSEGPGRSLQLGPRRKGAGAIDIRQGEDIDEAAFKALVRQAVALNTSGKRIPNCSLMYGHCSRRVKTDRRDVAALAPACRHRIDRCAHRRSSRQRVVQWPLNVRRARLNLGGARDHSLARLSDCRWRDGHVCDPTCRVGAPGVSE